ncbi:MAG: hypothetical protein SNI20_02055 [Rikenellaceae bacterium]
MKKFFDYFVTLALAVAVVCSFGSCESSSEDIDEPNTETPDTPDDAIIPTISLTATVLGDDDYGYAEYTVSLTNAVSYSYTYYEYDATAISAAAEEDWTTVEVSEDGNYTLRIEDAAGNYTLEAYATSEDDSVCTTITSNFTIREEGVAVVPVITLTDATVAGTSQANVTLSIFNASSYSYYYCLSSAAPSNSSSISDWTVVEINVDGDYTVKFSEAAAKYTLYAYASGECDSEIASIEVEITDPSDDTQYVASISATPLKATLEITNVNLTSCDGILVSGYAAADASFESSMLADIEAGTIEDYTAITEPTTIAMGEYIYLSPATDYFVEIVAYTLSDDGTYTVVGDVETINFSTATATIGASSATIDIAGDDANTSYKGISGTVSNNDNIEGYYRGIVAKSTATSGVTSWVNSTSWLLTNSDALPYSFYDYDFNSESYTALASQSIVFTSLDMNTEYYIFAIPVDNDGYLGQIAVAEISTKELSYDSSIIPDVKVTPSDNSATVTITFGDCAKVFVMSDVSGSTWATLTNAETFFLDDLDDLDYFGCAASDYPSGVRTYDITKLSVSTTYVMYYMGVSAAGAIGDVQSLYFTTTSPNYDADASLTITIDESKSQEFYKLDPVTYPEYSDYTYADVVVNIEMTNGAVSYLYAIVMYDAVTIRTAKIYANYMLSNTNIVDVFSTTASTISFTMYCDYRLITIPVDADGAYGSVTITDFPWGKSENGILYNDSNDTSTDEGATEK